MIDFIHIDTRSSPQSNQMQAQSTHNAQKTSSGYDTSSYHLYIKSTPLLGSKRSFKSSAFSYI